MKITKHLEIEAFLFQSDITILKEDKRYSAAVLIQKKKNNKSVTVEDEQSRGKMRSSPQQENPS